MVEREEERVREILREGVIKRQGWEREMDEKTRARKRERGRGRVNSTAFNGCFSQGTSVANDYDYDYE